MQLSDLRDALGRAMSISEDEICKHIADVEAEKRAGGIERVFADAFHKQLPSGSFYSEVPVGQIGAKNYWEERIGGRVDCSFPEIGVALEYKAVKMPRRKSDCLFDVGQLVKDYLRLRNAEKLECGFVVVFVYGNAIKEISLQRLYQEFHNQMFVDVSIARDKGLIDLRDIEGRAIRELGWVSAWPEAKPPESIFVTKSGPIGAVCIPCSEWAA